MAKIVIVFASMSGNTEDMTDAVEEGIRETGQDVDIIDTLEYEGGASALEPYEGILIGTYTWVGSDLPDEFFNFYNDMIEMDLTGKKAAVYGSFDWDYGDGGLAVNKFHDALKACGAMITHENLKVELEPDPDALEKCRELGRQFAKEFQ